MLREIQERDNKKIKQIIQTSLEDEGLALPNTAYFDPYLGRLSEYYDKTEDKYWVVEENGRVVGGVGIGKFGNRQNTCELQKLYIDKTHRKKGYSHLLMRKALAYAEKFYDYCYLETFASLRDANKLYEKYGFYKLDEPFTETEHSACDTWYLKEF